MNHKSIPLAVLLIFTACFFQTLLAKTQNASQPASVPSSQNTTAPPEIESNQSLQLPNTTNTTSIAPEPELKDLFQLEIDHLREQILLTEKKIQLLTQLKAHYEENNLTIPAISMEAFEKTLSSQAFQRPFYAKRALHQRAHSGNAIPRDDTDKEERNLMNKIFRKFSIEVASQIKQVTYLPTKSIQRVPEEPSTTSIVVLLTSDNEILLYSMSGHLLLSFKPGHSVKSFAVNCFNDEYLVVTLGTDNTIRMHKIGTTRVRIDVQSATEVQSKKVERAKFAMEFNSTLEYIYDLEAQKTITEEDLNTLRKTRRERNFYGISVILGRSLKFVTVGDENGAMILINRNGTHKGKFTFPDSARFVSIQKHHPNPIYATEKSVGFFNPILMDIASPHCDLPGEQILKVEPNQWATNEFSVLLQSGDILFYEIKPSSTHCKAIAKRSIPNLNPTPEEYNIYSTKDFLLIKEREGSPDILAHNVTDVVFANVDEIEYLNISLYPSHVSQEDIVKSGYIAQRNTFASSQIGAYFEFSNGTSIFSLHELTILAKPSTDWLSSFRMPVIFIAIILAIGYQFWSKKKKRDQVSEDEAAKVLQKFGKDMGRDKLENLRSSIDSLTSQTEKMKEDLRNLPKKYI